MAEKTTDWERIESDYRAGILSLREIAANQGVSHVSVSKRAKKEGWTKDLSAKIAKKAEELVNRAAVNSQVNSERSVTDKQVIEANADAIVRIRLSHRKDISRSRSVVMSLLDELELTCGPENAALLAEFGEVMRSEDDKGQDKRNDLYQKLMSLGGRAKTMKDLGDSLKTLVGLEREAFGLESGALPEADGSLNLKVTFGR